MSSTRKKACITWDALRLHVKEGDIWIAINGRAYNVSDWAKVHPGGELVLMHAAGKDATSAFNAYHPDKVAEEVLERYCIGDLWPEDTKMTKVGFALLHS